MSSVRSRFLAAGGNRHPAAADWDHSGSGLLAFGANNNVALWAPQERPRKGITALLRGHQDVVNAVAFHSIAASDTLLLTGAADCNIKVWRRNSESSTSFTEVQTLNDHTKPINCIASLPDSGTFISGSADASLKVWHTAQNEGIATTELAQSISLTPRYLPLCVAVAKLDENSTILAVAGTKTIIQVFVSKDNRFSLAATLTGHESWIRSLKFTRETPSDDTSDLLLASASQDKYIRLWRIHQGVELPSISANSDPALEMIGKSLSNKAHRFVTKSSKYSLTFEALLLGHEDWIYTVAWHFHGATLRLLSASADNSMAIWEPDPSSGIWICQTRLGEISAQKGATTATGSTGGFWIGLWSGDGASCASLGRTGSWRLWNYDAPNDSWLQDIAVTGHTKEARSVCWSQDHTYLLSTGADQTTRLYAPTGDSWHEFSRPQIHGYDLNCLSSMHGARFVSGADEKLLRVFDEPGAVADILRTVCDIHPPEGHAPFLDAANIPVLGLSNKAIQAVEDGQGQDLEGDVNDNDGVGPASVVQKSTLAINHAPYEDQLSRHLLWPETEKLYGHGYEISAVAASHDGSVIATACKASSIDHAVIRLYETKEWREIRPSLAVHTLTVTSLAFSPDDQYLLSVGRDRQWAIFERNVTDSTEYKLFKTDPKGHSRMILDCAWAPSPDNVAFATAGRDKRINIWQLADADVHKKAKQDAPGPVTAIAFMPRVIKETMLFAYGIEDGSIFISQLSNSALEITSSLQISLDIAPSRTVNSLTWRQVPLPRETSRVNGDATEVICQLAAASDDASVRLYDVQV